MYVTWLKSRRDASVKKDMLSNGYSVEHTPHPTGKGGGVAIIHRSSLQLRKETTDTFRSFEHIACRLTTPELSVLLVVVYHTSTPGPLNVMGDLNFHVNDASNIDAKRFSDCVNSVGMVMQVRGPTHKKWRTLDTLLTRSSDEHLIRNVTVADCLTTMPGVTLQTFSNNILV